MARPYNPWKTTEEQALRDAVAAGLSLRQAATLIGRPLDGVQCKARDLGLRVDRSILARIRRKCVIDASDPDSCWIWQGMVNTKDGKPRINVAGSAVSTLSTAMREAGLWKPGWRMSRVTCGDTMCVRPQHGQGYTTGAYVRSLYADGSLGTASHNAARAKNRRRWAKLSEELVRDLRAKYAAGATVDELHALVPTVGRDTLQRAIRGRTWADARGSGSVFAWRPAA